MNIRGVWLENVCDSSNEQTTDKSVVPQVLPALLHVFLAGLYTEKISSRRIIVITVISGAEVASGRKALHVLGLAEKGAGAEALRKGSGRHCEYVKDEI